MAGGEEPPYLTVGTDVSAKYKGAFCEAKIKKVTRSVKCKVTFKNNNGSALITDDQVRGTLRVGAHVEAKHPEKNQFLEAVVNKLHDYSQYTVVFDDGDETTLRRTSLCLKSGRHFAESETLDQLPLTHPEHFGTPVMGTKGGRKRRSLRRSPLGDVSSDDDAQKKEVKQKEPDPDMGKVVCVEVSDKKKQKDNWFPGLVVSTSAHDVRVKGKDEYLVRSFKDGKYHVVSKKETREFTREIGAKVDNNTLKTAVERALQYVEKDDLPPHWDRDALFRTDTVDDNSDDNSDSDTSDDEPSEQKDRFVAQLYKFMDDRGTPINKAPTVSNKDLNLYKLFRVVRKMGGYNRVTNQMQWKTVYTKMGLPLHNSSSSHQMKKAYKKYLHSFEGFERKLGCTMGTSTRSSRVRHCSGRNLIMTRDRDREFKAAGRRKRETKSAKQESEASKAKAKEATEDEGNKDEPKADVLEEKRAEEDKKESVEVPAEVEEKQSAQKEKPDEKKVKDDKDSYAASDSEDDKRRVKSDQSKSSEGSPSPKRRGRKRIIKTDDDKSQDSDDEMDDSVQDVNIVVGDRVKVKYGRGRQQKIYEAKVLKADDEDGDRIYFVHYTGWNMRYDEWVKRHRIVENLTQKISGKRMRRTSLKNKSPGKRGRPAGHRSNSKCGRKSGTSNATRSRTTRSDRKGLIDSPFASGLEPRRRIRKSSGLPEAENAGESSEESGLESGDSDEDTRKRKRCARHGMPNDELDTSFEEKEDEEEEDEDVEEDEEEEEEEEDEGEQERSEDEMDSVRSSHSAGSRMATRREKSGKTEAKEGCSDAVEPLRKSAVSKTKCFNSDEDEGSEEAQGETNKAAKRGKKQPRSASLRKGDDGGRTKKGRPKKVASDDDEVQEENNDDDVLEHIAGDVFPNEASKLDDDEKEFAVDLSEIMSTHGHFDEDGKCVDVGKAVEGPNDDSVSSSSPFSCDVSELVSSADKVQIADVTAVDVKRAEGDTSTKIAVLSTTPDCVENDQMECNNAAASSQEDSSSVGVVKTEAVPEVTLKADDDCTAPSNTAVLVESVLPEAANSDVVHDDHRLFELNAKVVVAVCGMQVSKEFASEDAAFLDEVAGGKLVEGGGGGAALDARLNETTMAGDPKVTWESPATNLEVVKSKSEEKPLPMSSSSAVAFERLSSTDEEEKVDLTDAKKLQLFSHIGDSSTDEDSKKKPLCMNEPPTMMDKFDALLEDTTTWRITYHGECSDKRTPSTATTTGQEEASDAAAHLGSGRGSKKERRKQKNRKPPEKRKMAESDSDDEGSTEEEPKVKKRRSKEEDKKGNNQGAASAKCVRGNESKSSKKTREKKGGSAKCRKGESSDYEEAKSQKRKLSVEKLRHKECKRKKANRKGRDDERAVPRDSDDGSSFSSEGGGAAKKKKSRKHKSREASEVEKKRARKSGRQASSVEHTSDESNKEASGGARTLQQRKEDRGKSRKKEKFKRNVQQPSSDESDSSKESVGKWHQVEVVATKAETLATATTDCDISRYLMCEEDVPASPVGPDCVAAAEMPGAETKKEKGVVTFTHNFVSAEGSSFVPISTKHEDPLAVLDNTPPTTPESNGTASSSFVHHHEGGGGGDSPSTSPSGDTDTTATAKSSQDSSPSASSDDVGTEHHRHHHHGMRSLEEERDPSEASREDDLHHLEDRKFDSKRCSLETEENSSSRKRKSHKKHLLPGVDVTKGSAIANKPRHLLSKSPRCCDREDFTQVADIFLGAANSSLVRNSMATAIGGSVLDNLLPSTVTAVAAPRSPRPSRFNFYVDLDEYLDASERIAVLQEKLTELRRTYLGLKAELACIDRRRKKLKRKEKEATAATITAAAAAAPAAAVDCSS